ncbi:MAG: PDZ domain-containing protein [Acidobacteriota bacterium]|nr:PDZ domain-containing protein [Acidobacteriota bacterium]
MKRTTLVALTAACLLALISSGSLSAQALEPIRYTLRFPAPHTHYFEVEAAIPTAGRPEVEVYMATWTPGSYLLREYQRHVEAVTASAGSNALAVEKSSKNRWKIQTTGARSVTLRYRVYGREMTVRNNWVEAGFAMLNGAPTFITLVERAARPHEVRVELAPTWKSVQTALLPVTGTPNTFRAEDFDTLVDSPIIIGSPVTREFTVDGKKHVLVLEGDPSLFDADRAAADVKKIVEAGRDVMGPLPYPHYYFLNMVVETGGGLEHKNSFLTMSSRFTTRTHRAYQGWLGLVAHEFFHAWNIKRLRPVELGPFDYENENYVKTLWVAEGFTDYYAEVLPRRAGLATRDEFLDGLSDQIEAVQTTPGRLVTPVDMSSYDTWIKQYRPDENTANTSVNYYPKGAVIAFLLDAKIRQSSNAARTLDTGMQWAMQRYSGDKGFTPDQFYQVMSEAAGTDLKGWFARAAESTDELDYSEALDYFGLRFRPVDTRSARAFIGGGTRNDAGRLVVTSVRRGTPAIDAGLNVDDEILAIDEVRVRADGLAARLELYKPGDKISVLVARRDKLTRLDVTLGADPGRPWRLEVSPTATAEQKARLMTWTGQ